MKRVVDARLLPFSSINAPFKSYFWELELECGHVVERRVRWLPQKGPKWRRRRGWSAQHHGPGLDRLPPDPKRAKCEECEG